MTIFSGPTSLLMIEPTCFGFNEETAVNNYFQQMVKIEDVQAKALAEFTDFVSLLRYYEIVVNVIQDTPFPPTPDSIFPNNWISFHEGGRIVLYPMFAKNRRAERKHTVLASVDELIRVREKIDFTHFEQDNKFLEGTGSMVLDRNHKIAYACLSERTHGEVLELWCKELGYTACLFHALDRNDKEIYHTNVLMCVADKYAIVCLDAIQDETEKEKLVSLLATNGQEIISINFYQMEHFCGNMLQVHNIESQLFLVMSTQAYENLTKEQVKKIESYNPIIHSPLYTIETIGGGSARCMMAEVYS